MDKGAAYQPSGEHIVSEPLKYIDPQGRTWHPFSVSYRHPIDEMEFTFKIWAIDYADAAERVEYLRQNAVLDGQIIREGKL